MTGAENKLPMAPAEAAADPGAYALVWPPRLARRPFLGALLGYKPSAILLAGHKPAALVIDAGNRAGVLPSFARWSGIPTLTVEDGFIRSMSARARGALSLLIESTMPGMHNAGLIAAMQSTGSLISATAIEAMKLVLEHRISRHNDGAVRTPKIFSGAGPRPQRVVVVDQTEDDPSLPDGPANAEVFRRMLHAAREENPAAELWVVPPDTFAGRKRGFLARAELPRGAQVLTEVINPFVLLECIDRVYTVSARFGFEALLKGLPVSVFGRPFYSGRGLTDDRAACEQRARALTVEQIFAAAYVEYPRYLDPVKGKRGNILDAIEFILHQRRVRRTYADLGAIEARGFSAWKQPYVKPYLQAGGSEIHWRPRPVSSEKGTGTIARWGAGTGSAAGAQPELCVEDGFIRSIGLGSDFSPPWSLVLDRIGVYFDPRRGSQLEQLLNEYPFDETLRRRAESLRLRLIETGVTKYNVQRRHGAIPEPRRAHTVVLVTGQVEDDASIVLGATDVKTSAQLLKLVRERNPDAHLIYKPHPDVLARNRRGLVDAGLFCDEVDIHSDVLSLIERSDEVHTITSLSGFEALLRGKPVVTYGRPFYAGWGLTQDHAAQLRRKRRASLDELVGAALILYPLYWDWDLDGFTSCEAVVERFAVRLSNQNSDRQDGWQRGLRKASRWFANVVVRRSL